jgi:hypothetical protein
MKCNIRRAFVTFTFNKTITNYQVKSVESSVVPAHFKRLLKITIITIIITTSKPANTVIVMAHATNAERHKIEHLPYQESIRAQATTECISSQYNADFQGD